MRTIALLLTMASIVALAETGPKVELLWPGGAPGAVGNDDADRPSLSIYLPGVGSGAAVVVCPGGGYAHLAVDHEGSQIAKWLNSQGIAAFVLKYRLGPRYKHPAPLQDAQRALRYVRLHAREFRIEQDRIGIWGFSAGGHLAATAATHFDSGVSGAPEAIDQVNSRPDFLILAYPVITFQPPYAHQASRKNLLGTEPDSKLVENLSNDLQVTSRTPPTFLFHTSGDTGVTPENSVLFYLALRKAGVPAEMHIYERGLHGVGLAATDPVLSSWPERLADWLKLHGMTK